MTTSPQEDTVDQMLSDPNDWRYIEIVRRMKDHGLHQCADVVEEYFKRTKPNDD